MSDPAQNQTTAELIPTTMKLTHRDVANAEDIRAWINASNKAHAVSISLSLTAFLIAHLRQGADLLLRRPDGMTERIVMKELEDKHG